MSATIQFPRQNVVSEEFLTALRDFNKAPNSMELKVPSSPSGATPDSKSFFDHLKENVAEVNGMQKVADSSAAKTASGQTDNIHETMLALTKAELSFNLMVQIRNRALEAYQEVMRMQV